MATRTVEIPGVGSVTLYKRRGNRSIKLSIAPSGEVRVSLPAWVPYKAGEQFVASRAEWIAANRRPPAEGLQQGQPIGKAHHLQFVPSAGAEKVTTRLRENQIEITYPESRTATDTAVQKAAKSASIRALRQEAEALLPQRLRQLAAQTGFSYRSVAVRQLKGRWGSCSAHKDITLNLFLMQLPWHLIDYVLVHELVHTKVLRHGPPFWQELEDHLSNAKQLRKEMRGHHPVLSGL